MCDLVNVGCALSMHVRCAGFGGCWCSTRERPFLCSLPMAPHTTSSYPTGQTSKTASSTQCSCCTLLISALAMHHCAMHVLCTPDAWVCLSDGSKPVLHVGSLCNMAVHAVRGVRHCQFRALLICSSICQVFCFAEVRTAANPYFTVAKELVCEPACYCPLSLCKHGCGCASASS